MPFFPAPQKTDECYDDQQEARPSSSRLIKFILSVILPVGELPAISPSQWKSRERLLLGFYWRNGQRNWRYGRSWAVMKGDARCTGAWSSGTRDWTGIAAVFCSPIRWRRPGWPDAGIALSASWLLATVEKNSVWIKKQRFLLLKQVQNCVTSVCCFQASLLE